MIVPDVYITAPFECVTTECVTSKRGDSDTAMYTEPLQTTRQGMSRTDANLTNLRTGTDQKRTVLQRSSMTQARSCNINEIEKYILQKNEGNAR